MPSCPSLRHVRSRWASIGYGDQYGFRGLTSLSATEVNCGKGNFGFAGADRELKQTDFGFGSGFAQAVTDAKGTRYVVQNSPVVEFISKVADSDGMHAPIFLGAGKRDGLPSVAVYPPNTLFRLREVIERSFTIDENGAVCPSGTPNSLEIKQPLYRVTATFISTTAIRSPGNDGGRDQVVTESKTVSQPTMLQYSDRTAFIDGLNSLLLSPSLTMEQEFSREMSWTDRRGGVEHTLVGEWKYVNGEATRTLIAGIGERDVTHEGWLPVDFLRNANELIQKRREEDKSLKDRLPESHAYLSLDEVLAIRLYSGPAFAPINIFLRQLGKLSGIFKTELARHAGITFIHTTKHIMAGIRKLSAIMMDDEMEGFLYRGVRGQVCFQQTTALLSPLCRTQQHARRIACPSPPPDPSHSAPHPHSRRCTVAPQFLVGGRTGEDLRDGDRLHEHLQGQEHPPPVHGR